MRCTALLTALLCLVSLTAWGQDEELEYKMDFGGGIGVATPIGDAGGMFSSIGLAGGLVVRRIFNPRMALRTRLSVMRLTGTTDGYLPTDAYSKTPAGGDPTTVTWKRGILDLGCTYEMNFWGFGSGPEYKGNKPITPYIAAGVGMTMGMGGGAPAAFALNIPLAVGMKYKLKPRLNLELEWSVHFTTSDKLDATSEGTQLDDPYGVKGGWLKNRDCYSQVMVSLTYSMFPKLRKCNN